MLAPLLMALSIAQCLHALGTGPDRARWTSFEDHHRWSDAVRAGLPIVSEGVQCVTGVRWTAESATLMITPLQWAVLLGVDAYRSGDVGTLRALGNQYLPIAERYEAGDRDDFDRQAYRHATLYLRDFRQGRCTFDLCTQKNYP